MSLKTNLKDDLDLFFNEEEFADEVSFYLGSRVTKVVVQVFDEESDLGDSIFRKLIVKVADLPTLSKDGYFAIDGENYKVIAFIPDEMNLIFNVITQKGMK